MQICEWQRNTRFFSQPQSTAYRSAQFDNTLVAPRQCRAVCTITGAQDRRHLDGIQSEFCVSRPFMIFSVKTLMGVNRDRSAKAVRKRLITEGIDESYIKNYKPQIDEVVRTIDFRLSAGILILACRSRTSIYASQQRRRLYLSPQIRNRPIYSTHRVTVRSKGKHLPAHRLPR